MEEPTTEEARSAESSGDFVHKVAIAGKEVSETVYWLRLARRAGLSATDELGHWIDEAQQLTRILAASARTARGRVVALDRSAESKSGA